MLHELAHMWFGDSVSPYAWSDVWLNEGHADWYELIYAEEHGYLVGDTEGGYPDPQGYATLDELMRAMYAHGDEWRKKSGPVALPKSGAAVELYSDPDLRRWCARPVRAEAEDRHRGVRAGGANVGPAVPRQRREHRRLHRACN